MRRKNLAIACIMYLHMFLPATDSELTQIHGVHFDVVCLGFNGFGRRLARRTVTLKRVKFDGKIRVFPLFFGGSGDLRDTSRPSKAEGMWGIWKT